MQHGDTAAPQGDAGLVDGEHVCASTTGPADHRRLVSAYVRAGLAAGDVVVVLEDERDEATVLADLRADGVDTEQATATGQLAVTTAHEAYLPDGRFDVERQLAELRRMLDDALWEGHRGLRTVGTMSWAEREGVDLAAVADYERRATAEFRGSPAAGLCVYGAPEVDRLWPSALASHDRVLRVG